jgi:GH43 family beta-xylosidase
MGGSLCDAANWKKHEKPLLVHGNGVYGPGHASFFRSPDQTEVWCAYHGMKEHNETVTPASRYFHIQRVDFDDCGYPVMGQPVGCEVDLIPPAN